MENKKENVKKKNNKKQPVNKKAPIKLKDKNARTFEYNMPKDMAKAYLMARNADEKKANPQDYLCKQVNTYGLKGTCVKVNLA